VGPCEGAPVGFDLLDPANRLIDGKASCGDFGPTTLPATGTYRIQVHADQAPARYTFAVRETKFDTYSIKIGDTVSPDRPAVGAGIIALPGQRQTYSFRARPGEVISVHVGPCEGAPVGFDVLDSANRIIGGKGGCGDSGPVALRTAGVYRIVVHASRGTARYTFVIGDAR
jgi:hypothetical protein